MTQTVGKIYRVIVLEESILSKEKYHLILLIYGILKNDTSEHLQNREWTYGKVEAGGGNGEG